MVRDKSTTYESVTEFKLRARAEGPTRVFSGTLSMNTQVVFFSSRRRHTRYWRDWSSDVCSSDLTLRATHHRAGDVQKRPELRLPRHDELFGDLRSPVPFLEHRVQILEVLPPDRVLLVGHGDVAHHPVEEALEPDQQLGHVSLRLGAGEAEEGAGFVHVAQDDDADVALRYSSRAEEGRGAVVAAAGRDGRILSVGHGPSSLCALFGPRAVVESLFVRVRMRFPLSSEGTLGRAASIAARHPSYRIEGENGAANAAVELKLPEEWRSLDDLRTLLKGEREAEYAADGMSLSGDELFGGLGCFLRKQRRGASAREWCTPEKLEGKQLFPCKQIRVYDNNHPTPNSWYAFGQMGERGVFEVDKEGLTERVLSDLGPCARCPILDLEI